jgi:large subunit ribosomal protein L35
MAKLKTHKTTAKRFRVTKTGKLIYKAAGWGHLKSKKNARIKYRKRGERVLEKDFVKNIKKLMPGVKLNA